MNKISLVVLLFAASSTLSADVLISETVQAQAGGRAITGVRTTYIKGSYMRVETVQNKEAATTLYDLPAGVSVILQPNKKRAELREIAARHAELERLYPRERAVVTVNPTGASKEVAAAPCNEHAFNIRVPMTSDGGLALLMTGTACVATSVAGAQDYATFAQAAIERQLVLGSSSSNRILLAMTRAQTELYRTLVAVGGIPYMIDLTTSVEGKGMVAGMVRKLLSGTRTTTVTKVVTGPLADGFFAIPDGWKREKK